MAITRNLLTKIKPFTSFPKSHTLNPSTTRPLSIYPPYSSPGSHIFNHLTPFSFRSFSKGPDVASERVAADRAVAALKARLAALRAETTAVEKLIAAAETRRTKGIILYLLNYSPCFWLIMLCCTYALPAPLVIVPLVMLISMAAYVKLG